MPPASGQRSPVIQGGDAPVSRGLDYCSPCAAAFPSLPMQRSAADERVFRGRLVKRRRIRAYAPNSELHPEPHQGGRDAPHRWMLWGPNPPISPGCLADQAGILGHHRRYRLISTLGDYSRRMWQ